MKTILWSILVLSAFCPVSFAASDSEVSISLDKMAKDLVSAYQTAYPKKQKTTMAVLPFHTSDELAKRKVGNALAELLTHSFSKYPNFKLVERVDINKIFSELKLSMSGVGDPEEALKVGKLSGASLQVFGSMEKIGSKYHINARMVHTETGDIVATAFKTVPASLFDEEAKYYLADAPVPKSQAIGIYLGYVYRPGGTKFSKVVDYTDPISGEEVSSGKSGVTVDPLAYSIGARYEPLSAIQLDYIYYAQNYTDDICPEPSLAGDCKSVKINLTGSRFLINFKQALSKKIYSYSGIGVSRYRFQQIDGVTIVFDNDIYDWAFRGAVHLKDVTVTTPVIYQRFEYRPQSRIGIGLSLTYEFKGSSFRFMGQKVSKVIPLLLEATAGVYF
ncbi:MAG: FlgO family outer membrane protein [Elusimicrobiota bacterium]|nr:FlgO family outer membrane protein [Elusimicrobiota bacterium]